MPLHSKSRWLPQDSFSFGAIALLLLAVALFSWFTSQHWINQRILTQLQELQQQSYLVAATATQDLQRSSDQISDIAQTLAGLSSTRQFLQNPRQPDALQADLDRFGERFRLNGIWLLDPQGQVLAQSPAGLALPAFGPASGARQAGQYGQPLRRFVFEPGRRQAIFYYAAPVVLSDRPAASVLIRADVQGISRQAFRIELLVTDANGTISLADNPDWLLHTLPERHLRSAPLTSGARSLPITMSPLLPQVLLLGPQRAPVLLATHQTTEADYQVHAMADAEPIYQLAKEQDRLAAIVTLAATGSLWGGLLTLLTFKRNRRHRLTVSRANNELVRLNQQLKQMATTDFLTHCPNRRAGEARLQFELANLLRHRQPFCIVMLDIDHFKHINDQYGHDTGDQVLRHFAKVSRDTIRDTDFLARIGGEEFLLILPQTTRQQGMALVQRLLDNIAGTPLYLADKTVSYTFSGGLTQGREEDGINDLLARADRALYQAKESGRCRICVE